MNTVASNTRNCREDGWDGRDAVCEGKECFSNFMVICLKHLKCSFLLLFFFLISGEMFKTSRYTEWNV